MKVYLLILMALLGLQAGAQSPVITGPTRVTPGTQDYYTVQFDYLHPYANVNWSVQGGTILYSNWQSCTVQWDNTPGSGYLSVEEDLGGQSGAISIQIGGAVPSLYPDQQTVYYGTAAFPLGIYFNFPVTTAVSYQWQEWNGAAWVSLPGYNGDTYAPTSITGYRRFRCLVTYEGITYDNLEATVQVPELQPGVLYAAGAMPYNTLLSTLNQLPPTGGYCTAPDCVWEQSIEEGPWTVVGTGSGYPAVRLTGATRLRRRASCNGQTVVSNTVSLVPLYNPGDWENRDYVREITVLKKGVQSVAEADALPIGDKLQTTTYTDGWGRPLQTVEREGGTPTGGATADRVQPYDDTHPEETRTYLSYATATVPGLFKPGAITNAAAYNAALYGEPAMAPMYAATVQEALRGAPVLQRAPGAAWGGASVATTTSTDFNTARDGVQLWSFGSGRPYLPYTTAVYPNNTLVKTTTTDEKGARVVSFAEPGGPVLLKRVQQDATAGTDDPQRGWSSTYYLYDDGGRLRYILPPKLSDYLRTHNWELTEPLVAGLAFTYTYDGWGRTVETKAPDAGPVYRVYDALDRPVATQDARQRAEGQWVATLYDGQDRAIMTGLLNSTASVESLQATVTEKTATVVVPPPPPPGTPVDLTLNSMSSGTKQATHSITLVAGFESAANTEFVAEIHPGALPPPGEITILEGMAIYRNPLPDGATFTWLTQTRYDDYQGLPSSLSSSLLSTGYNTYFSSAYNTAPEQAQEVQRSQRVTAQVTWTKVNVPGTSQVISTNYLYDERGRPLQIQSINQTGGLEVVTTQYDFSGKVLRTHTQQQKAGPAPFQLELAGRNHYDKLGRLVKMEKNLGNTGWKRIAVLEYNSEGQLKTRKLGGSDDVILPPDPNGWPNSIAGLPPIETLTYDYNIQGWLLGVNRGFVKDLSSNYFGYELGYDKAPTVVNAPGATLPQYNGNIGGLVWKSRGDGEKRRYDFSYDPTGRLLKADFTQKAGTAWDRSAGVDFSVTMGDGVQADLAYDANGNIKSMTQQGLKPGGSTTIDGLNYSYRPNSNQLARITDTYNDHASTLGDFTYDPATKDPNGADYAYDAAGNLVSDRNKKITAIQYNYLSLPVLITVEGRGTVAYTYDATGAKLRKVVTDNTGATPKTTTTLYLGGAVFQNDVLQAIGQEEGRVRPAASGNGWTWDYFLKDHLGNVRMVLTEEAQKIFYPAATLEGSTAIGDKSMLNWEKGFYTIDNQYLVARSQVPGWTSGLDYPNNNGNPPPNETYPADYTKTPTATSNRLYKLNAATNKTGLGQVLKVMAGDKIDVLGNSYYQANGVFTNSNSTTLVLGEVIGSLLGTPAGGLLTGKGVSAGAMEGWNSGKVPLSFFRGTNNETSSTPKAYINYLFFDEQFRYAGGGASRVGSSGAVKRHWYEETSLRNLEVPKNGYLYVYVSNESNTDVYFDNLQVVHTRGSILEETHYYPFGLVQQGISSHAAGLPFNKEETFQGQPFDEELGIDIHPFRYRVADPQNGRFWQVDPLAHDYVYNSTYAFSENKVTSHIELEGLESVPMHVPGYADARLMQEVVVGATITNTISSAVYAGLSTSVTNSAMGSLVNALPNSALSRALVGAAIGTGEAMVDLAKGAKQLVTTNPLTTLRQLQYMGTPQGAVDASLQMAQNYLESEGEFGATFTQGRYAGYGLGTVLGSRLTGGFRGVPVKAGSSALVTMTEETFSQALFSGAENVRGYSVYGTKGLVGNTYNRNIFLVEASGNKSLSGFKSFVSALESEAVGAGAKKISIYGSSVINKGFLNPNIAGRYGYSFEQSGNGVFLQKVLR